MSPLLNLLVVQGGEARSVDGTLLPGKQADPLMLSPLADSQSARWRLGS